VNYSYKKHWIDQDIENNGPYQVKFSLDINKKLGVVNFSRK
jgi:hypothetical protein